jgi:maltose/moltooligosaccharide transporter
MVASLGAGFAAVRLGRKRAIRIGLVVVCATMALSLFVKSFLPLAVAFAVGGMGWSLVNVNSLPMVVDMTTLEKVGGYTGLYYFFSQAANIIAPPAAGAMIDAFGYGSLMIFAAILFLAAFFIMALVRRGEVVGRRAG